MSLKARHLKRDEMACLRLILQGTNEFYWQTKWALVGEDLEPMGAGGLEYEWWAVRR